METSILAAEPLYPFHSRPAGVLRGALTLGAYCEIHDLAFDDLVLRLVGATVTTDRKSGGLFVNGLAKSAQTIDRQWQDLLNPRAATLLRI